jgi:DNA polymerase-3 subunit gamma/tau
VGKTTCARIFAKVINCLNPTATGDACGECESCKAFAEGRSLNIFELDAASNNGVEQIKTLMEQTHIPPQTGKYKVFIIDEVHMLSTAAFNAFLKTLEEPPAHVIFILATTEKHKILPTIISRCQIYDFERMSVQDMVNHLKYVAENEGITYEEEALNVIAEKADGGMRDALSIFDQAASFCQGNITRQKVLEDLNMLDADNYFNIIDLALENKVSEVMLIVNSIFSHGFDGGLMINGLASHVRNVLMSSDERTTQLIEASEAQRQKYAEQAKRCTPKFLYRALKLLNQCDLSYRQSSNKRLLVELTLIQVAQITQEEDGESAGRGPKKRLKSLFNLLSLPKGTVQRSVERSVAATKPTITEEPKKAADVKPRKLNINSLGGSFASLRPKKEKKEDLPSLGDTANENEEFTEEDAKREWLRMCNYMAQNAKDVALASRMHNVLVKMTEWPKVEAIFENTMLKDDVEHLLPRVQNDLAQLLHNGRLTVTTRLAREDEKVKKLTPQEIFDKIVETNPAFARMQKQLGLKLER